MKKGAIGLLIILVYKLVGQINVPDSIFYQGIARDANGNPLINKNIGIQLNIRQGTPLGPIVFTETHSVTTNTLGLFSLKIGSQNTSAFQSIQWQQGPYYLEILMDPNGGTSYTPIGTQQLLSVPYALYAKRSSFADSIPPVPLGKYAWKLKGNIGTNPFTDFIGTIDNTSLNFKTNNTTRLSIFPNGRFLFSDSPAPLNGSKIHIIGNTSDTLVARFSSNNSFASAIQIFHPTNYSAILLGNNTDTAFVSYNASISRFDIGTKEDVLLYSQDTLSIFGSKVNIAANPDTVKIFGQNNVLIGSNRNTTIYSLTDSINFYGRTRQFWMANNTSYPNHAFKIDFKNNNSSNSAGIKINHQISTSSASFVSYGIYISNNGSGSFNGKSIGLASHSNFNLSGGEKRSIDIFTAGDGTNIGLYLWSDTGDKNLDGYTNWSIYSNSGNIMIKDGHIKTGGLAPTFTLLTSTGVTGTLSANSNDIKGTIHFTTTGGVISATIQITFSNTYSQSPAVVLSVLDNNTPSLNINYRLTQITSTYFKFELTSPANLSNQNFSINYIVIE
ncbi:MAG: hypothetical protein N3F62_07310 [Bacteroidia bacterium]|nr:hypothetical protein [Bacteroidia bacterium]